ncbi:MAG: aminotransferase class I/II-fold pyridoxal phosphate-dependent enzyme [Corynebacterium sp.]|nr:aminotransferase class I/II-fold pyridoxal phosphate-dependent enzyme [Corynebacterium sp.]
MTQISELSQQQREALAAIADDVRAEYAKLKDLKLNLDLTRGKPSSEQLDFANELLGLPKQYRTEGGVDTRNYGGLEGITEIRAIYAELLGLPVENILAGDASSLNIEFDLISWAYAFGLPDSPRPWKDEEKVKWLCPVPGYDRHFTITEHFGFEMIPVPMKTDGPDMDVVAELVKDPAVKGMWTVPMFSNPTGVTFSTEVCKQLAGLDAAAPDFTIMWDNAYAIHILEGDFPAIDNVIEYAKAAGHPNRFMVFTSTSKITFAGSGVSFFAGSDATIAWYKSHANVRGIGPNKVNQLAHVEFFKDVEGLKAHMRKHQSSLAPKFRSVLDILDRRLGEYGIAEWTRPTGGYFISLDVLDGTASRVVELAKEAGIALTGAGSTYPLKQDPNDRNLRLAPSLPPVDEVTQAMDGVATCVLLAAVEKL